MMELNYLNLGTYKFATLTLPNDQETIDTFWEDLNPMGRNDVDLQWVEFTENVTVKENYNNLSFSQLVELSEVDCINEFDMVFNACSNFEEAMEKYNNSEFTIYHDCKNDHDLGWEIAVNSGLVDPDSDSLLHRYFDFEKYGQDCRFESGAFTQYDYDTMIEIHN